MTKKGATLDVSSNRVNNHFLFKDDMPIQDQTTNYTHPPILLKEAATLQWTFQDKAVVY
jgi:hypothetical protein